MSPIGVAPLAKPHLPPAPAFLAGGGEMGALIRGFDWAATPLGPPPHWPQSLKTAVQLLLNTGHPMYLFWGSDGNCLYNDAYRPSIGPERHPGSIGQPARSVWGEIWPVIGPQIEQVMAGRGATWHVNQRLPITRNGRLDEAYWTYSYSPIGDDDAPHGIGGVLVVCNETTAAVISEKLLADEVDRQRQLFTAAPGFITILDGPDHLFEFVNDSYRQLFGDRDYLGHPVRDAFPELAGQGLLEMLDEVFATGQRSVVRGAAFQFAIGPGGAYEERVLDFIYEPMIDDEGRVTGIFCEGQDVTVQRRAELALAASEEALRHVNAALQAEVAARTRERNLLGRIVETTDAMMMALDLDFRVLALNHATVDYLERVYAVRPGIGDDLLALFAHLPAHRAQVELDWGPAMRGEVYSLAGLFDPAQPEQHCFETSFRPLHDDGGVVIGAYKFVYDVTDRERNAARLAQAQDALLQAQKLEAMGQLTGGVAHDFNNLLTPIIGGLDMLQRRASGDARELRLIGGALQSAERARVLVQRLLAFARRQPLQPVPVDIGALLTGMADLIRDSIGVNIGVAVSVAEALPPAIVDPSQLELAVLNLCVNARDAMPGGGTIALAVVAQDVAEAAAGGPVPGHYVRLSVTDSGTGMDEPTRRRAVEPFFSTKGVGKGTGLGLSMAHGLALQLDGALTITSRQGHGTTVDLWLPVSAAPPVAERRAPPATTAAFGGKVALLVDDDDGVRLSTADMLGELGFTVRQAASGPAAITALEHGLGVDVLITDHAMPGMTGGELAAIVKLSRPQLPVLIVSGFAEHAGIDPAIPRLAKPFRRAELAQSLAALRLGRSTADRG